jgi:hypothetical protein
VYWVASTNAFALSVMHERIRGPPKRTTLPQMGRLVRRPQLSLRACINGEIVA